MVWENFISFNFYKNVFGITSPYALLCSPSLNIVHTHIHKYTVLILSGFQLKKYLYWNFHVPRVLLWPLANQRAKGFWGGALRDDTKNGSEGDYQKNGQSTLMVGYSYSWDWKGEVITSLRKHSQKKKWRWEGKWPGQGWPRGLGPVLSHVVYMTVHWSAQRQAHGKPFFRVFLRHLLSVVLGRCRWNRMPFVTNTFFQVNSSFVVPKTVFVRVLFQKTMVVLKFKRRVIGHWTIHVWVKSFRNNVC